MSEVKTIKCDGCGQMRNDVVTIYVRTGNAGWFGERRDFCKPCCDSPLNELIALEMTDALGAETRVRS